MATAAENEEVFQNLVVWLQKTQESMKQDGFTVQFNGAEYTFFPMYIDR